MATSVTPVTEPSARASSATHTKAMLQRRWKAHFHRRGPRVTPESGTPPNRGVFVANRTPPNRGVFFWQTLPLQFEGYLWRIVPLQIEGILLANHTPPNRGVFYPFKKRGYALAFVYNPPWAHPPPLSPPLTNKQQIQEQ
jgi:hypothetical protein